MQTMRILVGLPGSGKSSYARTYTDSYYLGKWVSVNWDSLRWFDRSGNPKDYKFSRQNEDAIKAESIVFATESAAKGFNVIVDNTNLSESARRLWFNVANNLGMQVEVVEFNTNLDECLRRNDFRTGWAKVPRPVIERMALFNDKVTWPDGKDVVLVDIDGTLADGTHRQRFVNTTCAKCDGKGYHGDPEFDFETCVYCLGSGKQKKDWKMYHSRAGLDVPVKAVIEWTRSLYDQGYYVCIVSGRGLEGANTTTKWLADNDVVYHRIFMRNAGDSREDSIIKKEILDKITPHANVAFAIDDRPRVIRMWRENGIKVYDVGKGVEF